MKMYDLVLKLSIPCDQLTSSESTEKNELCFLGNKLILIFLFIGQNLPLMIYQPIGDLIYLIFKIKNEYSYYFPWHCSI